MGDANAGFLKPDHREPPNRPFSEAHPARRRRRRAPVDPAEPAAAVWFGLQILLSLPPLRRGCKCGGGPELASEPVCVEGGSIRALGPGVESRTSHSGTDQLRVLEVNTLIKL